jgi:uncharacterized membrane protein
MLSPALRKALLAIHLTTSVGWLGAVVAYIPLDLTVAVSDDPLTVRSAWTAIGLIASWVIVPLALASLVTGILISTGTRWGLFRHWWVVVSLVLTIVAVVVLVQESSVIGRSAATAAAPATSAAAVLALQPTLPHSIGGLLVLLVIQWLNVFKPEGLTPYGWRRQQEDRARLQARALTSPARTEVETLD